MKFGPNIVTDGLVFCIDAANPGSYISGSGTCTNLMGSTIISSLQDDNGSGMYSSDNQGTWVFDGIDDYIQPLVNGKGTIFDTQTFTIQAWFKSDVDPDTAPQTIWSYDSTSHTSPYYSQHLRLGGSSSPQDEIFFGWNNGSTFKYVLVGGALTGTQFDWHNVAATYKSGEQKLYLDGSQIGSNTETGTITYYDQEVWVGRANGGSYFSGKIPNVQFYNRTLTAADVLQNYNALKERFI